jgi:putative ABC transport system ATP-binding protein
MAVANSSLISLRNTSRTYNIGQTVVHAMAQVNLEINSGEQLAIVGPSGSGKSTLMNVVGMLERPSEGDYFFDGACVTAMLPDQKAEIRSRSVGFVFQQFHLVPYLSAGQNVELPLLYQHVCPQERAERVASCLQTVGLAHRLHHRPAQLSGGERQRVAIARALVSRPKLILADEPTGALDSTNGLAVLDLMMALSTQMGATLLLITHDQALADRLPRCVRLLDGRVASDTGRALGIPGSSHAKPA